MSFPSGQLLRSPETDILEEVDEEIRVGRATPRSENSIRRSTAQLSHTNSYKRHNDTYSQSQRSSTDYGKRARKKRPISALPQSHPEELHGLGYVGLGRYQGG